MHTVELAKALANAGCEVQHFYLEYAPWRVGQANNCPIASKPIRFTDDDWSLDSLQLQVREAIESFEPDVVLVTDCWSLKPWLANAVANFPYILRFDALECLCPLNNLRVITESDQRMTPCTKHRLATPATCIRCVAERGRFSGRRHHLDREFSRFDTGEYHELILHTLADAQAVLVHNPLIAAYLEPYGMQVHVVPIGVDPGTFGQVRELSHRGDPEPKCILFAGRTTDAIKGFGVLRTACTRLWATRNDFRLIATGRALDEVADPFLVWEGWQDHAAMPDMLASADILAAPAIANEPFGLSVVEAMAAGRPVVASRVGGQQFTVVDGVTGLLCCSDDANDLADKLATLLDSIELRISMGNAGKRRFLAEYTWDAVIDRHYRRLFGLPARITSKNDRIDADHVSCRGSPLSTTT